MSNVAILLATYNGEKFIKQQLDSLVDQTYKDFICYIHDDGSKDNTVAICKEYCHTYKDQFIFLDYPSTGGAKNNFLSLMNHVEADYYFFCDQDDFWETEKIKIMLDEASKHRKQKKGILIYSDLKVVDEELEVQHNSFYNLTHVVPEHIDYKNSLIKGFIPGCSMMIDSVLMEKARVIKDASKIKMHDWWIVILAFLTEANIFYIDKSLVWYRQHSNNTIGAQKLSTMDRIAFNIKRIIGGELKKIKKENLRTPRIQAAQVYDTGFGDEAKRSFVKAFCDIESKSKLHRIFFYKCNFHDVYRMWWMLFWV